MPGNGLYCLVSFEMQLTKERKIYAGILAVVVTGLAIDRLVLNSPMGTPQSASAGGMTDLSSATTPAFKASSSRSDKAAAKDQKFISQLLSTKAKDHGVDLSSVQNVFHSSPTWGGAAVNNLEGAAGLFAQSHQLNAVMTDDQPDRGYAMVGGKMYRIGDRLDGFTLKSVSARSAMFESDGVTVELALTLDEAALAQ